MPNIRSTIRRKLPLSESVMTTIYHDFYGNRTGINNRIPMCPDCGYPVQESFYGNTPVNGKLCTCGGQQGPIKGRFTATESVQDLQTKYPKTFKHLSKRSREAELNTGDPAGENGTLHSILQTPPSKFQRELEHSLVHHVATSLGPDMDYSRTGRLVSQVRKLVPDGDIVGAFEQGSLHQHVEPLISGPKSDRFRGDADKYY